MEILFAFMYIEIVKYNFHNRNNQILEFLEM